MLNSPFWFGSRRRNINKAQIYLKGAWAFEPECQGKHQQQTDGYPLMRWFRPTSDNPRVASVCRGRQWFSVLGGDSRVFRLDASVGAARCDGKACYAIPRRKDLAADRHRERRNLDP